MEKDTFVFQRLEKKYLISPEQYSGLMQLIGERLTADKHGKSTVLSIYLDTESDLLIRNSINAKAYKEKIRLRSYGITDENGKVFLELKKKYKGIVYKRRVTLTYRQAKDYIYNDVMPMDSQIMREIDYFMHFYDKLTPKILIACEREAFFVTDQPLLRLTFDSRIRYRTDNICLDRPANGKEIIPIGYRIMEFKTDSSMPLWLVEAFNTLKIYPQKFSKYATAYNEILKESKKTEGESIYA